MSRELNCPNCGAPLGMNDVCEYCGTNFVDFTMDTEKPFYIKIRHDGMLYIDKVRLVHLQDRRKIEPIAYFADDVSYRLNAAPTHTYSFELMSLGVPHEEIDRFGKERP